MPKIEVTTPKSEEPGKSDLAWGTLVKVDGRELPHLRSFRLNFTVDDVVTADAVLLVDEGFQYEASADVRVTLSVQEGYRVVEQARADGSKIYSARDKHTLGTWSTVKAEAEALMRDVANGKRKLTKDDAAWVANVIEDAD